eukprot:g2364.t1
MPEKDTSSQSTEIVDDESTLIIRVRGSSKDDDQDESYVDTFFKVKFKIKMSKVFNAYAQRKHVSDRSEFSFTFNDRKIKDNDTPKILGMKDQDIVMCTQVKSTSSGQHATGGVKNASSASSSSSSKSKKRNKSKKKANKCPPIIFSRKFYKKDVTYYSKGYERNILHAPNQQMGMDQKHEEHGFKWSLDFRPTGNGSESKGGVAAYVQVHEGTQRLRPGWSMKLRFTLGIVNQIDRKKSLTLSDTHVFCAKYRDRGFHNLDNACQMSFTDLWENGTINGVGGFLDAQEAVEISARLDMLAMFHPDGHQSKSWDQYNGVEERRAKEVARAALLLAKKTAAAEAAARSLLDELEADEEAKQQQLKKAARKKAKKQRQKAARALREAESRAAAEALAKKKEEEAKAKAKEKAERAKKAKAEREAKARAAKAEKEEKARLARVRIAQAKEAADAARLKKKQEELRKKKEEEERKKQMEAERKRQEEEKARQKKARQMEAERKRQEEEKARQLEAEKKARQMEAERIKQMEIERARQFEMERARQLEMERRRQLEMERARLQQHQGWEHQQQQPVPL